MCAQSHTMAQTGVSVNIYSESVFLQFYHPYCLNSLNILDLLLPLNKNWENRDL